MASLINGMPIGVLLVAADVETADRDVDALLLDGLQRSNAMSDYVKESQKLLNLRQIRATREIAAMIEAALPEGMTADGSTVADAATEWLTDLNGLNAASGFSWDQLKIHLMQSGIPGLDEDYLAGPRIEDLVKRLFDRISDVVDVGLRSEFPVLEYRGSSEYWPEIFERLNRAGTPLTRYDVFAAEWEDENLEAGEASPAIRDIVRARYDSLTATGLELDFELDEDTPLSLFEYLFGLGRSLATDFPNLFELPTDPNAEVPAAFALVNVLLGLRTAEMSRMPAEIGRSSGGRIEVRALEAAIREACRDLNARIEPVRAIGIRVSGGAARRPDVPYSSNQIVSMVARLVLSQNEQGSWSRRLGDSGLADYEAILANAPRFLLHDVLRGRWSGSGDSLLFSVVWDEPGIRAANHYLRPIDDETMTIALDAWHKEQLEREHERRSVGSVEKLVLQHIYARTPHLDHAVNFWEVEHVYPVKGLVDRAKKRKEKWPINAISNLALLEKSTNRDKSAKSVADYLAEPVRGQSTQAHAAHSERIRQAVIGPTPANLDWTYGTRNGGTFSRTAFETFLRDRWEYQRRKILETLDVLAAAPDVQ